MEIDKKLEKIEHDHSKYKRQQKTKVLIGVGNE